MLRSKSLEYLPSIRNNVGNDFGWSEDATKQAMLDIIQSNGTSSVFERLHYDLSARQDPGLTSGRQEMWRYGQLASGETTARRMLNLAHIATPGRAVPFKPTRTGTMCNITYDVDAKKEKEYITRSYLPLNDRGSFNNMIMQTFYKAPNTKSVGYGMPRPSTREGNIHQHVVKLKNPKAQNYIKINKHRALCTPDPCPYHEGHSGEYCDILGPGTCSRCIENTNRHIADVIQKKLFPAIEVSNTCLVVPKLSKVLKEGHTEKKRLSKLNLLDTVSGPQSLNEERSWDTRNRMSSVSRMSTCASLPSLPVSHITAGTYSVKSMCLE